MYLVEADTINAAAICTHEHTTLLSKRFHSSTGCCINKTFVLYTIHRHKTHEQSIFLRSFILVF